MNSRREVQNTKIIENELIVQFDEELRQIVTYRPFEGSAERILHTVYVLSEMQRKGIKESGRIRGIYRYIF